MFTSEGLPFRTVMS